MSRTVCGDCLCPYGDDGQCACVEEQAMTTEAERDCKHGQLARSCNVCELEAEIERKDALLRQASELLHRQWSCSAVWSLEEAQDLDAAIKQHLGEQT